jgi:nickel transport protein
MSRHSRLIACVSGVLMRLVLPVLLLTHAGAVSAHSLQLFAAADGAWVRGQVQFAGGHPAQGTEVLITGADGEVQATLQTDASGAFSYRARAPQDLLVVAKSADGHRAQWPIRASELAGAFGAVADAEVGETEATPAPIGSSSTRADPHAHPHSHGEEDHGAKVVPSLPAELGQVDPATFAAIEQAVARQVRPLRESLAEAQARAGLQDVLGGLGYIAGLAGLGLWLISRRERLRRGAGGGG